MHSIALAGAWNASVFIGEWSICWLTNATEDQNEPMHSAPITDFCRSPNQTTNFAIIFLSAHFIEMKLIVVSWKSFLLHNRRQLNHCKNIYTFCPIRCLIISHIFIVSLFWRECLPIVCSFIRCKRASRPIFLLLSLKWQFHTLHLICIK